MILSSPFLHPSQILHGPGGLALWPEAWPTKIQAYFQLEDCMTLAPTALVQRPL